MKISEAAKILGCDIICGQENLDRQLSSACGADLMSDVLAFAKDGCALLTGMVNHHAVRTAQMLDVLCVIFVRGKKPADDVRELAGKCGIVLLSCEYTLYEACGLLYKAGLPACKE